MAQTDTEKRFWNRIARKYAADPIADMAGYERTLEQVRRTLKGGDAAYEFGCGTGTTALKLAPGVARYVASDISDEMIFIAREKAEAEGAQNLTFEVGTPDVAPHPDAIFDAALGFNILHLVNDRAAVYRSVHRLLKQGGVFITKTPCLKEMNFAIRLLVPVMQAFGRAPYVAFFNAAELEREIAGAGFEIVERARHGTKKNDARAFLVARKA
jgi:ubiquinone/menaquinone biosynthesis C-methylase UbiE